MKRLKPVMPYSDCQRNPGKAKAEFNEKIVNRIIIIYGLFLLVTGILMSSPADWLPEFRNIVLSSSLLLTDYMGLASPGIAFINAGVMTCLYFLIIKLSRAQLNGSVFAAIFMLSGFSLFGKNLFNSLPLSIGVFLYCKYSKTEFKDCVHLSLYAACLGPLVSSVAFHFGLPIWQGILYSWLLGMLCGFLLPPVCHRFEQFHQGYSLYNMGFSAGIFSMVVVGILRYQGYSFEHTNILFSGSDDVIIIWIASLLILLFLAGITAIYQGRKYELQADFAYELEPGLDYELGSGNEEKRLQAGSDIVDESVHIGTLNLKYYFKQYRKLTRRSGCVPDDFVDQFGIGLSLINMSLTGGVGLLYALVLGGELNGPILGAILCMVGYASYGKHIINTQPILIGVLLANVVVDADIGSTSVIIAALLGTTLAPVAGRFGAIPGIIAGMAHMMIISTVGSLHAGTNLYNTGFTGGFIAILFVPIFSMLEEHKVLPRQLMDRLLAAKQDKVTKH
ncbi:MAG TPA: DUF1576 domain-containing protein [Clostridiaceae bacterium]|nr:DUF1576 domain-containing protein [Clostridiaceae bacterium]